MRTLALLATCLFSQSAVATNNSFLPGDAFFSVSISQEDIKQWTASTATKHEFDYERFDGSFFACGNIGYSTLAVEGITSELRLALVEAYWSYASGIPPIYRDDGDDGKIDLQQINSVVALIYDKSFNLDLPLGLKFNEDWMTQGAGHYAGLFETADPIAADWKMASEVPPLTTLPKMDPLAHLEGGYEVARTIDVPLRIHADETQIILVGFADQKNYGVIQRCPNLQSLFENEEGARYMVITKDMIRDFSHDEDGIRTETVIKIPLTGETSRIPKASPTDTTPKKPNSRLR